MTDMQPQNIESRGGLEQPPVEAASTERVPVLPSPEGGIETGADRREQTAEAQAAVADAATAAPVAAAQPVAIDPAADASAQPAGSGPAIAGDEDVIEKEWVDKAKQIIETTKGDPHQRTERVNQLQKDYLKKRYGKELGASG